MLMWSFSPDSKNIIKNTNTILKKLENINKTGIEQNRTK